MRIAGFCVAGVLGTPVWGLVFAEQGIANAQPTGSALVAAGTEETDRCDQPQGLTDAQLNERAADHYDRGQVHYEQGDYEGAIEEFVAGFCNRPDASWYYNIGQSFERQLNYEKAVAYLKRYLKEGKPGTTRHKKALIRVEVLSALPARLTVATEPKDADVTMRSATGVSARGVADGQTPLLVTKGDYQMRIELAGHEPITYPVSARIGEPRSFYFRLQPKQGQIRISATPPSARIFIDKKLVGVGSFANRLPIGRYQVTVEANDRPSQTRPLDVAADNDHDLKFDLPARARSGRSELLVAATVGFGVLTASAAGTVFDQDEVVSAFAAVGGLGLGFGGAYLGIPRDVTVGTSSYLIGATLIGAAEGVLLTLFFACDQERSLDGCADQAAGGVFAGAVGGLLFASLTQPTFSLSSGDAALINSGAQWGLATGALFFAIFDENDDIQEPLMFAGLNLGIVTGAALSARYDLSRKRIALIDLGGIAGFVAGSASVRAVGGKGEQIDNGSLAGLAAGLITAAFLTRNIDDKKAPVLVPSLRTTTDASGNSTTMFGATLGF